MTSAALVYDSDCAFCCWWVRYWARLTGDAVRYLPLNRAADEFPGLDVAAARRAVQFIDADGRRAAGAAASFLVLAVAGKPLWHAAYRRLPGFAGTSEWAYRVISRRRDAAAVVARALWGDERHPAHYACAARLFLRFMGLAYCAAFASLAIQLPGLLGDTGVLPAARYLDYVRTALGETAWLHVPSLLWLVAGDSSIPDAVLSGAAVGGALAGLLAAFVPWPRIPLVLCWVLYLSLFTVGQAFMSFQWDLLLLEAGFLALFLRPGARLAPFLFRLLLFRFMFLSGCVKLLSGDPAWAGLAALDVHYMTQPLPSPLAWYAHHLPAWFHRLSVVATFVIELVLPFLIFAPRRPRMVAAAGFVVLETLIVLTGNYNFFNLLTIALVLFLFEDRQMPARLAAALAPHIRNRPANAVHVTGLLGLVAMLYLNAIALVQPFARDAGASWLGAPARLVRPLRLVNSYGLFAVMTTSRLEIEIEASRDGRNWQPYRFRYKPDGASDNLHWIIPHQPRLDWQLWFAALSTADRQPWFGNLLYRLLEAEPTVLDLFDAVPFGTERPRFVRALVYDYRFTTPAQRAREDTTWQRRYAGLYHPAVHLQ